MSSQVVRDGSNLRNEFKSTARQLVRGNSYNIFLAQYQSPEDARQYTANKVAALLNQATGAWMHNGVDEKVSKTGYLDGFYDAHTILYRASKIISNILPWKKLLSALFSQHRGQSEVVTRTSLVRCAPPLSPLRAVRYVHHVSLLQPRSSCIHSFAAPWKSGAPAPTVQ